MATQVGTGELDGTLLEACNCNVLCPCWIGEDPDNGQCHAVACYHLDRGTIGGVDVSGLSYVGVVVIPGNILQGNMKRITFLDDDATPEQVRAAFSPEDYRRLRQIKRAYDPDNIFRINHNIPPAT